MVIYFMLRLAFNVAQSLPMDAQLVIRLPLALKERCEQIAEREMMSVADVARQALKQRVEADDAKAQTQTGGAAQQAANGQ